MYRKWKQPTKRKSFQSDSESDHDDSTDDDYYVFNKYDTNSTDSDSDVKSRRRKQDTKKT